MANGDYLTFEELMKYSEALEKIKGEVASFVADEGLDFAYNVRGWPSILIRWKNANSLKCTLQLYMNVDKATFTLWVAVSKDLDTGRYTFTKKINEVLKTPFDAQSLLEEMKDGLKLCNSIKFEDLTLSK